MSSLILPRRFTSQPQGAVELDTNYTNGAEVVFVGNNAINIVTNGPRLYLAGNTEFSTANGGLTVGPTGTGVGSIQFLNSVGTSGLISSGLIVFSIPTLIDNSCIYSNCWDYTTNSSDTGIGINTGVDGRVHIVYQDVALIVSSSVGAIVAGETNTVAWSYNGTTGLAVFVVNGKYYTATTAKDVNTVRTKSAFGDYYNASAIGVGRKKFLLGAIWSVEKSRKDLQDLVYNPWQLFRAKPRVLYFTTAGAGGDVTASGATLSATYSLSAGSASGAASVAGASLSHTQSISAGSASGAASTSGASLTDTYSLTPGNATAAGVGTAAGASFTHTYALSAGSATGAALIDGVSLSQSVALMAGSATVGTVADGADLTISYVTAFVAATGAAAASGASLVTTWSLLAGDASVPAEPGTGTLTPETIAAIADAVWAHSSAVDISARMDICSRILRNKTVTDPDTGVMTVYADDGVTPYLTAQLHENVAETQTYRGQGAEVRGRLQ